MKSRTSCFNAALLRRDLTRMALIWIAYLLIWLYLAVCIVFFIFRL